ncbi:MAG: hypothetical protein ACE5E5_01865 [Phycisphaerae bacterium]
MAMDNKQKTMLGVLVVLLLGMGGYWFTMMGDNSNAASAVSRRPTVKRVREKPVAKKKKGKRRKRAKPKTTVQRRERDTVDTKKAGPKRRRGKRGPKEKKKKVVPAA